MVGQQLLARKEYLAAENRILKAQLKGRMRLTDAERATLGEIDYRLGLKFPPQRRAAQAAAIGAPFPALVCHPSRLHKLPSPCGLSQVQWAVPLRCEHHRVSGIRNELCNAVDLIVVFVVRKGSQFCE
jgi:hypothetical protein